jgi:hypothetical protein
MVDSVFLCTEYRTFCATEEWEIFDRLNNYQRVKEDFTLRSFSTGGRLTVL